MFDLKKYLGVWYEIGRTPNFFEEENSYNVTAEYSLNKDGDVLVLNKETRKDGKIHEKRGVAKVISPGKSIFKAIINFEGIPFPGNYNIIYITDNYDIAIVYGNNDMLWILSR